MLGLGRLIRATATRCRRCAWILGLSLGLLLMGAGMLACILTCACLYPLGTARQSQRNLARARMDLMYRGMDETQIEERMAQLRRDTSVAAVRDLKLGFILSKAADAMEIGVTQDELIGRVTQIAQERGVRAEELLKQLSQQNQLPYLAQQIREHKALDRMMGSATVTELPLDEFNKKYGMLDKVRAMMAAEAARGPG